MKLSSRKAKKHIVLFIVLSALSLIWTLNSITAFLNPKQTEGTIKLILPAKGTLRISIDYINSNNRKSSLSVRSFFGWGYRVGDTVHISYGIIGKTVKEFLMDQLCLGIFGTVGFALLIIISKGNYQKARLEEMKLGV